MKIKFIIVFVLFSVLKLTAQEDTKSTYQKKVLESTEIDILMSFYTQDGIHSSVAGGEGTEELTDVNSSIVVIIPINGDDVLTVDIVI